MAKVFKVSVLAVCIGLTVLAVEGLASRAVDTFAQTQLPSDQQFITVWRAIPTAQRSRAGASRSWRAKT